MDFKDQIFQIADRFEKVKENLLTEEATKNALIMPFISALGYDIFNPTEVLPEMTCDIGTKKGEKIDYAILKNGEPIILIECKQWQQNLNLHDNQLLRYFNVSKAKFGILTNGVTYRFYTDISKPNVMDEKPFLEIDLRNLKESQIEEVKKFHKSYFDIETILSTASELKYLNELKAIFAKELAEPSQDFVKYFGKQVYEGLFSQRVSEQFTPLLKRAIQSYISDQISSRLNVALAQQAEEDEKADEKNDNEAVEEPKSKVETTTEEMEGYYIVKSILRKIIPSERITYRDAATYFSVFIDDNNRKLVCRLYLNSPTNKRITFIDENKKEIHNKIEAIDEIYNYSEQIINSAQKYL